MFPHILDALGAPALLREAEVRALLAALTSFLLVLVLGRRFIRFLKGRSVLERTQKGDSERLDELHAGKQRTPTLGGAVLFGGTISSALLWADALNPMVLLLSGYSVALAAVGFIDDYRKLKTRKGISARRKLLAQVGISLIAAAFLQAQPLSVEYPVSHGSAATCLFLPFFKGIHFQLGLGYIAVVVLVTTGASNAVNLTDGLDGLATGCSLLVAAAFTSVALALGHEASSELLRLPFLHDGLEIAVFLSALMGAGLGFLWFNCHPAQIFMGDTGSLPLGGVLGLAAVMCKQEVLLLIAGGVLVAEALSVILQVGSYKLRRKRIFLCAPLHHHFQFKGWPETKITVRFWIAGALLAIISLVTLNVT